MKNIVRKPKPVDRKSLKLRFALDGDCAELVTESCVVRESATGAPTLVYLELDEPLTDIIDAVTRVKYKEDWRTGGLPTIARVFGYQPRVAIRRDFCTVAGMAYDHPTEHEIIARGAGLVETYYKKFNPKLHTHHKSLLEKVLPEYRLAGTVFTSGIVNKNNQLRYHQDNGNFSAGWSNMLVFKNQVKGGHLAVPEYGLAFELKNRSLLMFEGQKLWHGVTPITLQAPGAYRYSLVYYSMREMCKCLTMQDEVARIRAVRMEREKKRAAR